MPNARITAIKALIKTENDEGYSNIVIDKALDNDNLSKLDRAFASALFYGVLERKITLDYILSKYLKNPVEKTDITVLTILRCGIYQLKFMDKVPDNAAVNESVKCAVSLKKHSAKGFVNAVLRSFIRDGKLVKAPKTELETLSVKYSVPMWLVKSYINDFGKERAEKIMAAFLRSDYLSIRVNTRKIGTDKFLERLLSDGYNAKLSEICEDAIIIKSSGKIEDIYGFKQGYFHVQDVASQLCAKALSVGEHDSVLDVCAAPGGKSFTIAEMTDNSVTACDLYEHKIKLIETGAKRLGLDNIKAVVNDASKPNENFVEFDRVLCDLPCSGLGILGKKPEIRYKNVTFLDKLPSIQYHLLEVSSRYVAQGGLLIYSTCTLRHEENHDVANRFLNEHPEFEAVEILPQIKREIDEPKNMLTLMPYLYNTDGFFISCFRKRGSE